MAKKIKSEWIHKPRNELDYGLKYIEADEDGVQLAETYKGKTIGSAYLYDIELHKVIKILEERLDNVNK